MSAVKNYCHLSSCDSVATYRCGNCKTAYYCNSAHQILDWKEGGHKDICRKIQSTASAAIPKTKAEKDDTRAKPTIDVAIDAWKTTLEIDPQHAYAYYKIAVALFPNSTTMIGGKLWNPFELLRHSITLNPNFVGPLTEMALLVPPGQSIDIGGNPWTQVKLYMAAMELDRNYFLPYHNLAVVLPDNGTVKIDGKEWTKKDLYKKAQELISTEDLTLHPSQLVRHYYQDKQDAKWRKQAYREEVWGDQSLSVSEQMEQASMRDFSLRLKRMEQEALSALRAGSTSTYLKNSSLKGQDSPTV